MGSHYLVQQQLFHYGNKAIFMLIIMGVNGHLEPFACSTDAGANYWFTHTIQFTPLKCSIQKAGPGWGWRWTLSSPPPRNRRNI